MKFLKFLFRRKSEEKFDYGDGQKIEMECIRLTGNLIAVRTENKAMIAITKQLVQRQNVLTQLLREGLEEYKEGSDWVERVVAVLKQAEVCGDE